MSTRTLIMIGMFMGSTLAGMIPCLWGDGMFSATSMILSLVGAVVGCFGGYKLSQAL